jgi:hypothetical protein
MSGSFPFRALPRPGRADGGARGSRAWAVAAGGALLGLVACSAPPPGGRLPVTGRGADAVAVEAADAAAADARAAESVPDEPPDAGATTDAGPGDAGASPVEASSRPDAGAAAVPDGAVPPVADAATPVPPSPPAAVVDGTAVVHRLGCDAITRGQVDRQIRIIAARSGRAADPATVAEDDPLRLEALDEVIVQRVVLREARALRIATEAWEIAQAAQLLAQGHGTDVGRLYGLLDRLGVSQADYDAELEAYVLHYKLIVAVTEREGVTATDEQIEAEYRARIEGLDPATVRPLADAREGLRQDIEARLRAERGTAWLAERRAAIEALRTTTGRAGCTEHPPQ